MAPVSDSVFPIQQAHVSPSGWRLTLAPHSHCPPLHRLERQVVWLCHTDNPHKPLIQGVLHSADLLSTVLPSTDTTEDLPQWHITVAVPPSAKHTDSLSPFPNSVAFPSPEQAQAYRATSFTTLNKGVWIFEDTVLGLPHHLCGHLTALTGNALGIKRQLITSLMPLLPDRWLILDTTGQLAKGLQPVIHYSEAQLPINRFGLLPLLNSLTDHWPQAAQTLALETLTQLPCIPDTLGECWQALNQTWPQWLESQPLTPASNTEAAISTIPECHHSACTVLDLSALRPGFQHIALKQIQNECQALTRSGEPLHVVWYHPDNEQTQWLQQHAQANGGIAIAIRGIGDTETQSIATRFSPDTWIDAHYLWPLQNLSMDPILSAAEEGEAPPPHDVRIVATGPLTDHVPLQVHVAGHHTQHDYALDLPDLPEPTPIEKITAISFDSLSTVTPSHSTHELLTPPGNVQFELPEDDDSTAFTIPIDRASESASPELMYGDEPEDPLLAFDEPIDLQAAFLPDTTDGILHTRPASDADIPDDEGIPLENLSSTILEQQSVAKPGNDDPFDFSLSDESASEPEPMAARVALMEPRAALSDDLDDDEQLENQHPSYDGFDFSIETEETPLNTSEDPFPNGIDDGFDVSPDGPETESENNPAKQAAYVASLRELAAPNVATAATNSPDSAFQKGQRVQHPRYGDGTIQHILTTGGRVTLRVQFDTVGKRLLDAEQSNLTLL